MSQDPSLHPVPSTMLRGRASRTLRGYGVLRGERRVRGDSHGGTSRAQGSALRAQSSVDMGSFCSTTEGLGACTWGEAEGAFGMVGVSRSSTKTHRRTEASKCRATARQPGRLS